jgi:NhaA family Na+:H+ antiporter
VRVMQRCRVHVAWAYALPACALWFGLLAAGIHPTIAGVTLGLLTPMNLSRDGVAWSPVESIERALHPWVAFGVMPLFALANAGVTLDGVRLDDGDSALLVVATAAALVLGKPLGIIAGIAVAVKLGLGELPSQVTWRGVCLVGCLGGVGFTMSIFIGTLAFGDGELLAAAKLGVVIASVVAGGLGLAVGRLLLRRTSRPNG